MVEVKNSVQGGDHSRLLRGEDKADNEAPPKKTNKILSVCIYILGCELCERLAYYGMLTNFMVYLTEEMQQTT